MIEWRTLEHGIEVASLDGLPLLIIVPTAEQTDAEGDTWLDSVVSIEVAKETIEGETGWRVVTKTIAGIQDPRGWTMAVELAGKLAEPMTYEEWREAPRAPYGHSPESIGGLCECAGLVAYSSYAQLTEEWRGHPAGTWAVWASGVCGFAREVGLGRVAMAMAQAMRP